MREAEMTDKLTENLKFSVLLLLTLLAVVLACLAVGCGEAAKLDFEDEASFAGSSCVNAKIATVAYFTNPPRQILGFVTYDTATRGRYDKAYELTVYHSGWNVEVGDTGVLVLSAADAAGNADVVGFDAGSSLPDNAPREFPPMFNLADTTATTPDMFLIGRLVANFRQNPRSDR